MKTIFNGTENNNIVFVLITAILIIIMIWITLNNKLRQAQLR
jgi:hypothetical protein